MTFVSYAQNFEDVVLWRALSDVQNGRYIDIGAQPDADGELFYVDCLRRRQPELQVLWQLRNSLEAKNHDPGIAGLDTVLRRFRPARLPLVGRLFGYPKDVSISRGDPASYSDAAKLRRELI